MPETSCAETEYGMADFPVGPDIPVIRLSVASAGVVGCAGHQVGPDGHISSPFSRRIRQHASQCGRGVDFGHCKSGPGRIHPPGIADRTCRGPELRCRVNGLFRLQFALEGRPGSQREKGIPGGGMEEESVPAAGGWGAGTVDGALSWFFAGDKARRIASTSVWIFLIRIEAFDPSPKECRRDATRLRRLSSPGGSEAMYVSAHPR